MHCGVRLHGQNVCYVIFWKIAPQHWIYMEISLRFSTKFVFFEPTWSLYLQINLSKTIYFLKRTWFLYVLSKYHGMFKILQWNTRLRKTPTLTILKIQVKNTLVTVGIAFIGVPIKDQMKLPIVCFYIVVWFKKNKQTKNNTTLNTITYFINISYIGQ
jgi:hypothetical protein